MQCKACRLAKRREYRARPDVIAKNKAYKTEYRSRPGVRERERDWQMEYLSDPDKWARHMEVTKINSQKPKYRERNRAYMANKRKDPNHLEYERRHKANGRAILKCKKRGNYYERFDKEIIYKRDGWACVYCGKPLIKDTRHPDTVPTIDHVVPISRGGAHIIENCVTSCQSCNSKKHNKLLTELNW